MASPHVHETFDAIARRHSDQPALTFRRGAWQRWTYGELHTRSERFAALLASHGVRRGDAIGLTATREPATIAAMLAVLRLGAHFVPVDATQPAPRVAAMFAAAGVRLVVDCPSDDELVVAPVAGAALRAAAATPGGAGGDDPAYVMFTSGSTGTPKGVVVPHRAIVRLVTGQDYLRFDATRVFLQAAPFGFDASTLELWGPLLHGGRGVLYPAGELPTADGLREVIAATGVTTAWLTAAVFHAVVDRDAQALAGLDELIAGGEALSVPHVVKALRALPRTRLVNGYGPTENTTFTCCHRIPADFAPGNARVPIGRAIAGTEVLVVDDALQPVPVGVEGELLALGDGLALGYAGDAVRTRERFVDVRLADGRTRRAYRTGDRVVDLGGGVHDFRGRRDEQVKIHGYRIEPGEVEAVLAAQPAVEQARVLARRDDAGQTRLVGYLVLRAGHALADVQARLPQVLPPYMVPHQLLALPSLPLNANGKLDVAGLPAASAPAAAAPVAAAVANPAPRRGGALATVQTAWREVLGRAEPSLDTSFFDAGGRSLDAIRLHDLLERRTALALEPTFAFEHATMRRQAHELTQRLAKTGATASARIADPRFQP